MLKVYPDLVYLAHNTRANRLEVHFVRTLLIKQLEEDQSFPGLVFTAFERGLKHAGMYVITTTHNQMAVKRWGIGDKAEAEAAYAAHRGRKQRQRVLEEDDYVPPPRKRKKCRTRGQGQSKY